MADATDLPAEYLDWLDALPGPCYVKFRGREWDVATRERLDEMLRINRDHVTFRGQLAAWAKTFQGRGHEAAVGPRRVPFPYARLCRCVTIGSYNGDPLFVDPSDGYSLWMLRIDSVCGDVERVAPSIGVWVKRAKPLVEEMPD
jgi:hypothetical protein